LPKKGKFVSYYKPKLSKYGRCEICNREALLSEHHIFKRVIFGENEKVVHICADCHTKIDATVLLFETEILNKFSSCNSMIWKMHCENGGISESAISKMVKERFKKINCKSFRIKASPEIKGQKIRKENLSQKQRAFLMAKVCPICGKKRNLTIHHIRKWVIFHDNRELGFPCRKCHNRIEDSIGFFESEVLKHFGASYRYIWSTYRHEGYMTDIATRRLAKSQFMAVKNKLLGNGTKHQERIILKGVTQQRSAINCMVVKERKTLV